MPRRPPSVYGRRARQLLGRPRYVRRDVENASQSPQGRSLLAIAYSGVRRPCVCAGCIVLTPVERARQKRVFALTRAWHTKLEAEAVRRA